MKVTPMNLLKLLTGIINYVNQFIKVCNEFKKIYIFSLD